MNSDNLINYFFEKINLQTQGWLKPLNMQHIVADFGLKSVTARHRKFLEVTHKLSFQVSDSIKSMQDYGATEHSAPCQHQP